MKSLLSIKMWFAFFARILRAIFPAEMILIIFAIPSLKDLKKSRMLRLLIIFILTTLAVRLIPFFAGAPFSGRYFLPFAVGVAIFAVSGITPLVKIIESLILKKFRKCNVFYIYFILISIIGVSYSLKALRPRNDKPWLQMIPKAIKQFSTSSEVPIIVSNDLDERFGYYANTTELYKLNFKKDWLLTKQFSDGNDSKWKPTNKHRGIDNLFAEFARIGKDKIFIIVRVPKKERSILAEKLCNYDKTLSLIGTFTDRKKRKFELYKFKKSPLF